MNDLIPRGSHRHWCARRSVSALARGMLLAILMLGASQARALEHDYAQWTRLLSAHVRWLPGGNASRVDYAGFKRDHVELRRVLDEFSSVQRGEFDRFSREQRLAFLINAYNAFTIELILGKYPGLVSIKDLGGLFSSPWKQKFFRLLGAERSLDDIEHGMIRAPGAFDEPRIHFAVVCASIGCPALRPEAWRADRLADQLADSARRFLSDRSRNRYAADRGRLEVSKIFDWYGDDFAKGHQGIDSVAGFLAAHAEQLADDPDAVRMIRAREVPVGFLDYDWSLNDGR